ncbi:hypothetical protein GF323_02715 [Candidatus Woesearchaeota archaeon]|nr:hypothetical protein [Candidatus Woesearchaeota archaeon]
MLNPDDFRCSQCGKCCLTFTVKLSDKDIKRIESLGLKKEFFAEKDNFDPKTGKYSLKRPNRGCIFLIRKNNKYFCRIYRQRPDICRKYPFNESDKVESCAPGQSLKKRQNTWKAC